MSGTVAAEKLISIVIPFYNEEAGVVAFFARLGQALAPLKQRYDFELVCINDGSRDATLHALKAELPNTAGMRIVDFSRNFGKEAALTAGLELARGDAVIPIDSDLQHPPELIEQLLEHWEEGFDVVLARRMDRNTDRALHKIAARAFYRLSRRISHIDIPADVGDFRLMDRKVVDAINRLPERCRFMKGLFAWAGYSSTIMDYQVEQRRHGRTSFNLWKLWNFALEGITSFSTLPLRIWTYLGGLVSLASFSYAVYLAVKTMLLGVEMPGYASLMIAILFFSGIQLIGIGVLGEYIGRIFLEVKQRPNYLIREIIE